MANIDKLALVTKVLMDRRFLELKEENEALKLKMFWHTHSIKKLKKAMIEGNLSGPQCKCPNCIYDGLAGEIEIKDVQQRVCGFKPWFVEKVISCGLTIGGHGGELNRAGHMSCTHGPVYTYDYHILSFDYDNSRSWSSTTYGTKLWKAKSVSDPELQKLVALFKAIYDDVDIALGFKPRL
jgi:hypothetical protein